MPQVTDFVKDIQDASRDPLSMIVEELIATNSMHLHELYFGNLGGNGKTSRAISALISAQYGSLGGWEQDFRQTGLSLAGGSGWVILAYDPHQQAVHNYWGWDHANSVAGGVPSSW